MNRAEKILIRRVGILRRTTRIRGEPLILHGPEGEILYELLEMIANDYDPRFVGCGRLFIGGSPVFTDAELSVRRNTYHGYIS